VTEEPIGKSRTVVDRILPILSLALAAVSVVFSWLATQAAQQSVEASTAALRLQNTPFVEPTSLAFSGSRASVGIVNRGPSPAFNVGVTLVGMPDGSRWPGEEQDMFLGVGEEFQAVVRLGDFDEPTGHIEVEYQDLIGQRYLLTRLPWVDAAGERHFTYRFVRLDASGVIVEEMLQPHALSDAP
jgi:hypothetical protein